MEYLNYVKKRFLKKFNVSEAEFQKHLESYLKLKPFPINGNIFESDQKISPEVHFIMRLVAQYYMKKSFEAMLIDLDDPNVCEDLSNGNIGTVGRLVKIFCGSSLSDSSELGSGRWIKKPRIATFPNTSKNKIPITKRIDLVSSCSHHTIPFSSLFSEDSYALVSYIPSDFVIGISKLQRLVNWVSKRYWLQEDLTKAIYDEISKIAQTEDVYVKLCNLKHGCEFLRGALTKEGSFTSEYYGGLFEDPNLRTSV